MSLSLKNPAVRFALGITWLVFLLSLCLQVCAAPVWRTTDAFVHANDLGCIQGCKFGHLASHAHPSSNSTSEFLITSSNGEPIMLPELSAGHFLVIPVAAIAAIGYHTFKIRAGKPV